MEHGDQQHGSPGAATEPLGGKSPRLLALDAFRGLTIVAMILVNNPGSWAPGERYGPLDHADWHGWTPTDLIFPFFLFIVGTALAYSLRKYLAPGDSPGAKWRSRHIDSAVYWRIARRTVVLLLLGLMLNSAGIVFRYLFGESEALDFATLRLPGVLQRIALVYFAASLVVLHVGVRGQAVLASVLLVGYWALLAWLPNPGNYEANLSPEGNVVRVVDRAIIGEERMWTQATTEKTDPEGLLSTLPAVVTALMGYWTGLIIQRGGASGRTVAILLAAGLACAAVGQGWHFLFPINKKIWTSSFVLLTGGLAMVVLAGCLLKFDVWGWRRLARPWEIVGINAIFVFVASSLTASLLGAVRIATETGRVTAKQWIYDAAFTSWITDPKLASLAFALATVSFWWLILWAMSRRGWAIRV